MNPTTLNEYYTQRGQNLPSVNERRELATSAGIQNYSGTAEQNTQLLNYLSRTPVSTGIVPNGISFRTNSVPDSVQTPVVSEQGVNISQVGDRTPIVPTPDTTQAPVVPQPQFVTGQPQPLTPEETELERLETRRAEVEKEVSALEERLANYSTQRVSQFENDGIFEDQRALNELKSQLTDIDKRKIAIPIETRQNLRGRVATRDEFGQATRPQLENNLLRELRVSSEASRLQDTINTNIAIIDQQINAEKERDEFIYKQKQDYLDTIEKSYSTIMSDKQALALEERKFEMELERDEIKAERDYKQKLLDSIAEYASPSELGRLVNASTDELYAFNAQNKGSATATATADNAESVIDLIDSILSNETGLKGSVGTGALGRTRAGNIFGVSTALAGTAFEQLFGDTSLTAGGDIAKFRGEAANLLADNVLQQLIDIKAQGATLGALSDTELSILEKASTTLRGEKDDQGNYTGKFNMAEKDFKSVLEAMKTASIKTFIASKLGSSVRDARGNFIYKDSTLGEIETVYNELRAVQPSETSSFDEDFGISQVGNLPQRNNNPGNVKRGGLSSVDSLAIGTDSQGHLIFPDPQTGFNALALDLQAKINGNSRFVGENPTLAELGSVWAEDPNWVNNVSRILGVSPTTRSKDVEFESLLRAIARAEGYTV